MATSADNSRLVARLALIVVLMFGFGYAMVPLYDVICDITGLNGKVNSSPEQAAGRVDKSRTVTVEFMGNVNQGLPWEFKPALTKVEVHPGEPFTTHYLATNRAGRDIIGQAVPSVAPGQAARYFTKTECFCFTEQLFEPGETREMPLQFVVNANLPERVEVITLSYTFFDTGKVASAASAGVEQELETITQ